MTPYTQQEREEAATEMGSKMMVFYTADFRDFAITAIMQRNRLRDALNALALHNSSGKPCWCTTTGTEACNQARQALKEME